MAIIITQHNSAFSGATTGQGLSVAFASNNAAGNLIVVACGGSFDTDAQTATDSLGNTYTLAVGPTNMPAPGGAYRITTHYAKNILAGANTVTCNFPTIQGFRRIAIHEVSNADKLSPLAGTSANTGNSASLDSLSATVTSFDTLIFGWMVSDAGGVTAGTGFSTLETPGTELTESKEVFGAGSYNAIATNSISGPWIAQMAAFQASVSPTWEEGGEYGPVFEYRLNEEVPETEWIQFIPPIVTPGVGISGPSGDQTFGFIDPTYANIEIIE